MSVVNPTVDLIADTIEANIERAAVCSHRPQFVRYMWQDANARYLMAEQIAKALGLPWEREPDPGQPSIWPCVGDRRCMAIEHRDDCIRSLEADVYPQVPEVDA